MTKYDKDLNDRLIRFYQYLENRIELEYKREKKILPDKTYKQNKITYKSEKQRPIPSSY
jgi:site-specific DNA-adenine methylase